MTQHWREWQLALGHIERRDHLAQRLTMNVGRVVVRRVAHGRVIAIELQRSDVPRMIKPNAFGYRGYVSDVALVYILAVTPPENWQRLKPGQRPSVRPFYQQERQMKSANLFVRITVAIPFCLSTFGAFGSDSIPAGANRGKDR